MLTVSWEEWLVQLDGFRTEAPKGHDGQGLAAPPSRRLVVVTCMDTRIDPLRVLGLRMGEAQILRNAGARFTPDVLRSLVVSQQALGTDAVLLVPHTQCGLLGLNPSEWEHRLPPGREPMDFLTVTDTVEACREDLRRLVGHPWLKPQTRFGAVLWDVETGRLTRIREEARTG